MHITTDAIVLRERAVDEFDSVLTLLTRERGIISAFARGAKKPRGTMRVSAELLSYSCFVLFLNKEKYAVDKADLNNVFMGVRGDIEKLSLAAYFCQLTTELAPHEENADEYLRLLLNTLYMMDKDKRTCNFLKPLYELRLLTMAGFMPNLVACSGCACFEAEQMFFLPRTAQIVCGDCAGTIEREQIMVPLSKSVLAAMRHIIYAENAKLFQFALPEQPLRQLNEVCEQYVMIQLDKRFDTLDFYLTMRG
ncbi:DNA repair protein RecO [Oscillospiraceae bacterium PP1C4]